MAHRPEFHAGLLAPRYWPIWSLGALLWLLHWLPWTLRGRVADLTAVVYRRVGPRRLRFARDNVLACYSELTEDAIDELMLRNLRVMCHVYIHLSSLLFDRPGHMTRRLTVHNAHVLRELADAGRPVILLMPHWLAGEYAQHYLAQSHPLVSLVRPHTRNAMLDWIVTRMRMRTGGVLFSTRAPLINAVRLVHRGRWLCYAPDEDSGPIRHVFAPFFGLQKATAPTLERLAGLCDAVVIPVSVSYCAQRGRFELRFHAAMTALSPAAMNGCLEELIRAAPDQYMWFAKLFVTRP